MCRGRSVSVSVDEMRVARLVCRRWQLHFLRELPSRCEDVYEEFNELELDDLLRVMSFFCTLEAAGGWSRCPASRSKRIGDVAWRVERSGRLVRDLTRARIASDRVNAHECRNLATIELAVPAVEQSGRHWIPGRCRESIAAIGRVHQSVRERGRLFEHRCRRAGPEWRR